MAVGAMDGSETVVRGLPRPVSVGAVQWSPDGRYVAMAALDGDRIEPWIAEVASGKARRVADLRLNATMGNPIRWVSDSA